VLEVVDPGPLLLVEDGGRLGLAQIGVPPSGACDAWALAAANILAGAPPGAAGLEVTLGGTELRAVEACAVAIAGADLGAERDDGRRLATGAVHLLPAGARLRFAGGRAGLRAYVGFAGGLASASVLGSASTWAPGAAAGAVGRTLAAGDQVAPLRRGDLSAAGRVWPEPLAPDPAASTGPIRFVPGPDLRRLPEDAIAAFGATTWRAASATDRMGIRLEAPPLAAGLEILSHPLVPGAIQVPGDGHPLVLLVDGPTIGGYPVIGVVARADLPRLGQVRPGDALTFAAIDVDAARAAWRDQRQRLDAAAAVIAADDVWARLPDNAGG
jgi:antagonist of KipI